MTRYSILLASAMLAMLILPYTAIGLEMRNTGIEKRHEPLTPPLYTYLSSTDTLRLIESLSSKASSLGDPYVQALKSMRSSLSSWDSKRYEEAASTLSSLLLSTGPQILSRLSDRELKAMALLAASSLSAEKGVVEVDLNAYSSILEHLSSLGLIQDGPESLSSPSYLEDKVIRGDLGIEPLLSSQSRPADTEQLERIIASLLSNTTLNSSSLRETLREMNEALRSGDYEEYNRLAEKLSRLVGNSSLGVDEESLKKLSYLASTGSANGTLVFDPEKYARLLEALDKSGLLNILIPKDSAGNPIINESILREILPRDLNNTEQINLGELISGNISSLGTLEQFSTNGSLPNLHVPRIRAGIGASNIGGSLHSSLRSLGLLLGLSLAAAMAAVAASKEKHVIVKAIGFVKYSRRSRRILSGSPRTRIIKCFELLVETLSSKGYPRLPWETHREYSSRLSFTPYHDAVSRASKLYEIARYSIMPVGEEEASACLECLERVWEA